MQETIEKHSKVKLEDVFTEKTDFRVAKTMLYLMYETHKSDSPSLPRTSLYAVINCGKSGKYLSECDKKEIINKGGKYYLSKIVDLLVEANFLSDLKYNDYIQISFRRAKEVREMFVNEPLKF